MMHSPAINPRAVNLDSRWPLDVIDCGYVFYQDGMWYLKDFFGDLVCYHWDRAQILFIAQHAGIKIVERH